jgi:HK97 family phage major capsid protein
MHWLYRWLSPIWLATLAADCLHRWSRHARRWLVLRLPAPVAVRLIPRMAGGEDICAVVKAAVVDAVKPLAEAAAKIDPLSERIDAIAAKVEAQDKQIVRYDADGKVFRWPGGETKAPAFISGRDGDSRPLFVTNVIRALRGVDGGPQYAREELAVSDKLRAAGYPTLYDGGILMPFWPEAIPEEHRGLREEIAKRLGLGVVDPGEVGWLAKRYGSIAEAFRLTAKDLQLGDDTLGAALVPISQANRVIDLLRNRSVIALAGATEVPLPPSGNVTYPRLTADPTFTWTDPDTTTDAATSNVSTGVVRLIAKSLRGFVTIPNDLIRYSTPSVEMVVRAALAAKAAVAEDSAFLEGAGSSLQPKGIINYPLSVNNTPAVGKLTLHNATTAGANGDTLEPEDVRLIQAFYEAGNDPDPATAWIMRPLVWAGLTNARADAVTAGDKKGPFLFLSEADLRAPGGQTLQGVQTLRTMQASHNRDKGSSTDLDYILYGNFRRVIIGRSGALELAASEHVKFLQDKTILRAVLRTDMGLEHEESFVFTDDLEGFLP